MVTLISRLPGDVVLYIYKILHRDLLNNVISQYKNSITLELLVRSNILNDKWKELDDKVSKGMCTYDYYYFDEDLIGLKDMKINDEMDSFLHYITNKDSRITLKKINLTNEKGKVVLNYRELIELGKKLCFIPSVFAGELTMLKN